MKKTIINVLLLLMLSVALIVSCSQNAGEKAAVGEELVDISFSTMTSRALTATREAFDEKEYVWKYEAVKDDATGLTHGQTTEAKYVVSSTTAGLKGHKITDLSQGYWNFTLYAYKAVKDGAGNVIGHKTVYSFKGTVTHQKVVKGNLTVVDVTVSPNTEGYGSISFLNTILLDTLDGGHISALAEQLRMGFGVSAYETPSTPIDSSQWTNLKAGTYIVTVQVYDKDDPGMVYAIESKIVTVYTGLNTTIGGSVGELSAGIQFGDVTAEIIEATSPVIKATTSSENVVFDSSASTIAVTASLPTSTAKEILGTAEAGTTKEMTLTLEVKSNDTTVDPQTKETSKVYDISLMQTTVMKNNTTGAVSSDVGIIKNLSTAEDKLAKYYLTATLTIDAGLDNVSVTHSTLPMIPFTEAAPDYALDEKEGDIWKGFYNYNKGTGVLTIVTRSFSPFEVFYTEPTVVTYPVAVYDSSGNLVSGYSTVQAAVDAAAAGQTVKLLADIEVGAEVVIANGKNIVFDLNGHELSTALAVSGVHYTAKHYYAIDNFGVVEIIDSGNAGKVVARGIANNPGATMTIKSGKFYSVDGNGGASVWNEGSLIIDGGSFIVEGGAPASASYGTGCINSQKGSSLTINNATMISDDARCYAIIADGTTVINNADVRGVQGALAIDSGNAVINGGSFFCTSYYGCWVTNNGTDTKVTINGGSFEGSYGLYSSVDDGGQDESDIAISITGGKFTGRTKAAVINDKRTQYEFALTITGGSYSSDPSDYLAPGYFAVLGTDEYYTVEYDAALMAAAQEKGLTVIRTGIETFNPGYDSVTKNGFRYADGTFVEDKTEYRFYSDEKLYILDVSEVEGTSYTFRDDVDGIRGWGNSNITEITINSPLEQSFKHFMNNKSITKVNFGVKATRIPVRMFYMADGLVSVTLPNTVTTIERGAFQQCANLETLVLPSNLTEIPMELVQGCTKLSSMNIPKTVTSIGNNAIRQVALTKVEIPSGVRSIGTQAFRDCDQLVEIDVYIDSTKGLTIAQNAFSNVASPFPKTDMNIYNHDVFGFIAALNLSSASHITLVDMTENQVM